MKITLKAKPLITSLFCLAGVGLVALAVFFSAKEAKIFSFGKEVVVVQVQNLNCVSDVKEKIVRGNSLAGLIEDSQIIKIFFDYYDCNEVQRDDVIAYDYPGSSEPIIKIIKAISGDRFDFQEIEGGWRILINGEILKNSQNQPYLINEQGHKMLSLYQEDYNGVIPEKVYLILGNLTSGTMDSTRFGLVHKNDFLGKVSPLR